MTIQEVAGEPLPELVLISMLLQAVEEAYPEFTSIIEAQLSEPSLTGRTFEYVFGRFRTEFYRRKAR